MSRIITLIVIFVVSMGLLLSPSPALADSSGQGAYKFSDVNFNYYMYTKKASDPADPYVQTNTILGLSNTDAIKYEPVGTSGKHYLNDVNVKINIYADKPFFGPLGSNESYHLKIDSYTRNDECNPQVDNITSDTTYNLTVTTGIRSLCLIDTYWRAWKVSFWGGKDGSPNKSNTFTEFFIYVVPPNGQWPVIDAENPTLNYLDQPKVRVSNISPGVWYTLWWEGDWGPADAPNDNDKYGTETNSKFEAGRIKGSETAVTVILNSPVKSFGSDVVKQLNITVGAQIAFRGVRPLSKTFFTFWGRPTPTLNKACTVFPKDNPTEEDFVSLKATGMDDQKKYTAYLYKQKDDKTLGAGWEFSNDACSGNPKCRKEVLYFPFGKLPIGKYMAQIYNNEATPKQVCPPENLPAGSYPVEFEVGKTAAPLPKTVPCTGDKCSKAGGDPCGDNREPGFKTAIGCIHTNPTELVKDFMKFGVGIGGGLAFLMMLLGAFQMLTSAGNPETLNAGKERLTSAVIGLLFVIFSVLLLKIIGVDILGLGGQFGYKP